jgi:UDP-2,3-diacylglucosamine pyrophosphatase LpxH
MTRHERIDSMTSGSPRRYRAVFILDVLLGTRTSQVDALSEFLRHHNADGLTCGHIHHAADRRVGNTHDLNCGNWVENCTAVGESKDGEMHIIRWTVATDRMQAEAPQTYDNIR